MATTRDRAQSAPTVPIDAQLTWLSRMHEIRFFEDEVQRLFTDGLVRGSTHLYQGQEAVAVGACSALEDGDTMSCTYRGHGAVLAMGAPLDRTFGEIMGKEHGLCRGKGGSMHLTDVSVGAIGSFAIVGAQLPISGGAAFAEQYLGTDKVSLCFFGDGASNIGTFHEALNLAEIWKLPVIFVCENNLYGEYSPIASTTPMTILADRADAYGMAKARIDGNDVALVHATIAQAAARARAGDGPTLVEAVTYRHRGHSRTDPAKYRPKGELEEWLKRDPILLHSGALREAGVDDARLTEIEQDARTAVDEALARAKGWGDPPLSALMEDVWAPASSRGGVPSSAGTREGDPMSATDIATQVSTYRDAITRAMADALEADDRVFLLGEDIGAAGGAFKVTEGLFERFSAARVRDTPISEQAILGTAIGAALRGLRPGAELMFADFSGVCFDSIANELAKYRYMTGGQVDVPVVIRMANGAGGGFAAQHSQTCENWFLNVPGIKIVCPSTARDAYGLLRSAFEDPDPVLVFEHKNLYNTKFPFDDQPQRVPIGVAEVVRSGTDVTVVAGQLMRVRAEAAVEQLAAEGIEAELIDPRTIVPLDVDTVFASVAKTNRLLVVQEAWYDGSWGASLVSRTVQEHFELLDAPPRLLTSRNAPTPYAANLEAAWMPSVVDVVGAATEIVAF